MIFRSIDAVPPPAWFVWRHHAHHDQPPAIKAHLGDRATLTTALAGANIPPGAQPSYLVTGGVGNIIRQQVLIVNHRGTGTIDALYGGQSAAVPVTVD